MADGGGFCVASCCEECGSLSFSMEWYQAFGVVLCHQCKREEALISKGNAMAQYCLTAKDLSGLGCLSKDNPQKKAWSAMKLYLKKQVEERARRKHGDLEAIRQLRHDRAQAKVEGWLAKRARAGGGEEEEEGEEGDGEEEAGDGADSRGGPGGGGPAVRVKLSAAAARVRARLAAEYEGAAARAAAKGTGTAPTGAATAGSATAGVAAEGGDEDVEVF